MLGRAFVDDPVYHFLLGHPSAGAVARALGPIVRSCARRGSVTVAADLANVGGVAVWAPWGTWGTSGHAAGPIVVSALRGCIRNPFIRLVWSHAAARRHPVEPHRYLVVIGVDPRLRGRGIGTQIIQAGLVGCDARGIGAYTEAHDPEAVRFLGKFGFSVAAEGPLVDGAPNTWSLWRPPRR